MENHTDFSEVLFQFTYTMKSFDYLDGPEKFLNHYELEIWQSDKTGHPAILAGKGDVYNIRIEAALNAEEDMYELFDHQASLLDLGNTIFDFETYALKPQIMDFGEYQIYNPNVLFINRIELLPQFRGHGIGKKAIKDICHRFSCTSELVVVKAFPLQFEQKVFNYTKQWDAQMKFQHMERDEEKATYKMYSYYQSLGFQNILKNEFFFRSST